MSAAKQAAAILDVAVAIPHYYLDHGALAHARGLDRQHYRERFGCEEMAVCGPGDDAVSLAASAAWRVLEKHRQLRHRIGLCVVGTESGVDGARPVSIHVHGLLGLPSSCRVFEVKHACYGATAALQTALSWAEKNPERYALVVAADIARQARHSRDEPHQGAGAVALLVGCSAPREALLTLSDKSGVFASNVYDTWLPNYQNTALVKQRSAASCYLEALEKAFADYQECGGDREPPDFLLFHTAVPRMAKRAHQRLLQVQGVDDPATVSADFERRVAPSLWAIRRVGNIYGGSLYLSLAALCEQQGSRLQGKRVGLFSYGSGCCSEYFTARFGSRIAQPELSSLLANRRRVSVPLYEAIVDASLAMDENHSYDEDVPTRRQPFTFLGIRDHERQYRKNHDAAALAALSA